MKRPPFLPLLWNALQFRCPNCRRGKIFCGWPNKVCRRCAVCGLPFMRESGYFLGGMILTYTFTAFALVALFFLSLAVPLLGNMSENAEHIFWIVAAIALALLLVRPGYSLWLSADFWVEPWSAEDAEKKKERR